MTTKKTAGLKTADLEKRRTWRNGGLNVTQRKRRDQKTADIKKRRVDCDTKETAELKNGGHKEKAG